MDDEKAVEVMARAIAGTVAFSWDHLSDEMREHYRVRARKYLAAIRAEGGEVVFWNEGLAGADLLVAPGTPIGVGGHWAILRGPEVKEP